MAQYNALQSDRLTAERVEVAAALRAAVNLSDTASGYVRPAKIEIQKSEITAFDPEQVLATSSSVAT